MEAGEPSTGVSPKDVCGFLHNRQSFLSPAFLLCMELCIPVPVKFNELEWEHVPRGSS